MENFIISAFGDEIDKSLDVQMEVLSAHNIKHIELRGVDGKNVSDLTPEEARIIKNRLDEKGFKISALGSPIGKIGITDDFSLHLKVFDNLLKVASILDTNHIRIFSFYIPRGSDPGDFRDEVIRRLRELTVRAEQAGITLLHENEKDIYGDIPERCHDIFESIDSPSLKATFDPANFIQCHVRPYPHAFDMLRKHVAYVHIKDAILEGGNVVPAGYGDGSINEMLSELVRMGYKGFLTLEPHLGFFEGLEKLEKGIDFSSIKKGGRDSFGVAAAALNSIINQLK